jgi:selenocysteine-specific elongation factor
MMTEVQGIDLTRFALAWNLNDSGLAETVGTVDLKHVTNRYRDWAMGTAHWQNLCTNIVSFVDKEHITSPQRQGVQEKEISTGLPLRYDLTLLRAAIDDLKSKGLLKHTGAILHRPNHKANPLEQDLVLWSRIEPLLSAGGRRPPRVRELADHLDEVLPVMEGFLARAVALGWLYRVATNRYYQPAAVRELAEIAAQLADVDGDITASRFKTVSGIGRNVTINVLEFFDKMGFTQRVGDSHRVIRGVDEVFGN